MAKLIESLALSGSRKTDGAANASGKVWAYRIGTTTPATLYQERTGTVAFTQPVTLDAAGKATIYVDQPVTLRVETSVGTSLGSIDFQDSDGALAVQNLGFTGALSSGSQGAGGETTLDAVLTSALTSFGGTDFRYAESGGATSRAVGAWMREVHVSAKDFGALGDGIHDDTAAIQATINRVSALGAGIAFLPAGTYNHTALTVPSSGITIQGAGPFVTILRNTSVGSTPLTFTSVNNVAVRDLSIKNVNATAATSGVVFTTCQGVLVDGIEIDNYTTSLRVVGCNLVYITRSALQAGSVNTSDRGIKLDTTTNEVTIASCFIGGGSGSGVELAGSAAVVAIVGNEITGVASSVLFSDTYAGSVVTITGNNLRGVGAAIGFGVLATQPSTLKISGNSGIEGYSVNVASGGTVVPDLARGPDILITGTSTAVAYTISPPTPLPSATARNYIVTIRFKNAAGGAITGWATDAIYHLQTGVALSLVNGQQTAVTFLWDATVFRAISQVITTT